MSIAFVLITFLLQLSVGMLITVALLPPKLVDPHFFKGIGFWGALFTAGGLLVRRFTHFQLPETFLATGGASFLASWDHILFLFFLVLCLRLWIRVKFLGREVTRPQLLLTAFCGLAAVVVDSLMFRPGLPPLWVQNILLPLNFVSTALILGGFLAGMIFGHHYLMATEMPKRLLVTMAWILIGVLAFRIVSVGASLLLFKEFVRPDVPFLASLVSFQGHGIFFWQRILVGLAIPAVVVGLIYGTAKIGSNQSATGIMYVAIAFVFIGELAARYLFLLSAIPL